MADLGDYYLNINVSLDRLMPIRKQFWDSMVQLDLGNSRRLLHVGCGTAGFELFLREKSFSHIEVTASDHDEKTVGFAKKRCGNLGFVNFQTISLDDNTHFTDGYFDCALISDSTDFLLNPLFSIAELSRIIKPGGRVVFLQPSERARSAFLIRDQFLRIKNIKGLARQLSMLMHTVILIPVLFTAVFVRNGLARDENEGGKVRGRVKNGRIADFLFATDLELKHPQDSSVQPNAVVVSEKPAFDQPMVIEHPFDIVKRHSKKMSLHPPGREPIKHKPEVRSLTADDFDASPHLLDSLAESYRKVFGDPDIWGEGAYCSKNIAHIISLPEYERRAETLDLQCDCGGQYVQYYPIEVLKVRIRDQLLHKAYMGTFGAVLTRQREMIDGFVWGVLARVEDCLSRIKQAKHLHVTEKDWEETIEALADCLDKRGLCPTDEILLVEELGVLSSSRSGLEPLLALSKYCFDFAFANASHRIIFWTSSLSPLYKLAYLFGFSELFTTKHGFVFMYCANIIPGLKLFQNKHLKEMLPVFLESARKFPSIMTSGKSRKRKQA